MSPVQALLPRRFAWTAALLLFAALPASTEAASRLCRQIEATLAGDGGISRIYDRAIEAQMGEMGIVQRRLREQGCRAWRLGGSGCAALSASLEQMRLNLDKLQRARAAAAGSRAERARLRAALAANGCTEPRETKPKPVEAKAEIPPPSPSAVETSAAASKIRFSRPAGSSSVCVRLCDGYFFPMTRTTAPVDDQSNCEASCPAAPMEVFYRDSRAGEEAMTSAATGQPYGELRTAFQFRDGRTPQPTGCGCSRVGGKPATDPAAGTPMRDSLEGGRGSDEARGERRVRVVGPAFLPDPEEARGLQAPDPTSAR
jgi:hypothetical protein